MFQFLLRRPTHKHELRDSAALVSQNGLRDLLIYSIDRTNSSDGAPPGNSRERSYPLW
jgi:hypothetical protein